MHTKHEHTTPTLLPPPHTTHHRRQTAPRVPPTNACSAAYVPVGNLPPSILANKEPYRHGDWRKTPYAPRSVRACVRRLRTAGGGLRTHHAAAC